MKIRIETPNFQYQNRRMIERPAYLKLLAAAV